MGNIDNRQTQLLLFLLKYRWVIISSTWDITIPIIVADYSGVAQ